MTDRLRPQETAAMFTLMVLGREVSNPELKKLVGFTVTGKEKTRLEEGGYIASRTGARNACDSRADRQGMGVVPR